MSAGLEAGDLACEKERVVSNSPGRGLLEILQQVPDPRGREGLRHPMSAMLAAIICAH